MPYIFHEPVTGMLPARSRALGPGAALAIAIVGTTLTTVLLAAVLG